MSILELYETQNIAPLKQTASTSFAIYFIHPILIIMMMKLLNDFKINFQGNLFILLLTTTVTIALSMAIAMLTKRIFQQNSRYLIGW